MNIEYTSIFERNLKSKAQIIINVGSARSSKSYSLAQLIIYKLINEHNKKILVTRKTLPSLRLTAYKTVIDLLRQYGIYNIFNHNKSERIYQHNNNYIVFTSVDDPEKIRSTEWNYIWIEEANEYTWDDFITLKTRTSAAKSKNEINQIFLSLNPSDEQGWIRQKLEKSGDAEIIHSTYKDNPFLSDDYIKILEGLKEEDETYYKIYTLGEWATAKELIFMNWQLCNDFPETFDEVIYGMDFGFNDPTVLIQIGYKDSNMYLKQIVYETKITNADLMNYLSEYNISKHDYIYGDTAELARINEIAQAGYNCHPADKEVKAGIDFVKRQKLFIHPESLDLIREIKSYKWKVDKAGNVLDEPVHFFSHCPDAIRYGIYTHSQNVGEIKLGFV